MAKKSPEVEPKPQHDEYVENFTALTNGLIDQPREIVIKQVDHLLDKHALDYPEMVISWQLGRLLTEAEALIA